MACEAEKNRVNQLNAQTGQKAAYASMICQVRGQDSVECEGAKQEVEELRAQLLDAQKDRDDCLLKQPGASSRLLEASGYVTFLRVNEPGSGYGGGVTNWIDADVIFKLDSRPDKGFGFQLRDDAAEPVRRGMLSLLEDAIVNGLNVITDYIESVATPNNNCFVIRVALTRIPPGHRSTDPSNAGVIAEMKPIQP